MNELTLTEFLALSEEVEAINTDDWGEEDVCTWSKGYIEQPVYSCITCSVQKGDNRCRVGVCFGCYLKCHLHHEVEELFDKRGFRCDCPTIANPGACELHSKVNELNLQNKYNDNFKGLYCWCKSSYHPRSCSLMLQCWVCQDWFHDTCIQKEYNKPIPTKGDNDYVCRTCVERYRIIFTKYPHLEYKGTTKNETIKTEITTTSIEATGTISITTTSTTTASSTTSTTTTSLEKIETTSITTTTTTVASTGTISIPTTETKTTTTDTAITNAPTTKIDQSNSDSSGCEDILMSKTTGKRSREEFESTSQAISAAECPFFVGPIGELGDRFFTLGWQEQLCHCPRCTRTCELLGIKCVLDWKPSDREADGDEEEAEDTEDPPQHDANGIPMSLVAGHPLLQNSSVAQDPVFQMEVARRWRVFVDQLGSYLSNATRDGRAVTAEHIQDFMNQIKKKQ